MDGNATHKIDYNRIVAANIRKHRKSLRMTQESLAFAAGLSSQHLSKIERCACSPTVSTLVKLAECMGIEPAKLFEPGDIETFMYIYTDILSD